MKSKTTWTRLAVVGLPLIGIVALIYGCGTPDRPGATEAGGIKPPNPVTCSVEGQQQPCYELLAVQGGVRSCLQGTQTCRGGRWSACGGDGTIEATNVGIGIPGFVDLSPGQVTTLNHIVNGLADAGACANKCNPECRGYDEDAGPLKLDASLQPDAVTGVAATPPGFVDKLLRDKINSWGADCERWNTGNNETGWVHSACQTDYYCQRHAGGTNGDCVQFAEGPLETHAGKLAGTTNGGVECATVAPDLTLGTPCGLGGGIIVPICNRGSGPVAAGTVVQVSEEGPSIVTPTAPTLALSPDAAAPMLACPTFSSNVCNVTLAAALNPGQCVRFSGAVSCAGGLNGNKSLYVNSDRAVTECIIQPRVLGPPISSHGPTVEQKQQYGCANNYTAFNASQVPACAVLLAPKVVTFAYAPACSVGEVVQWGKLGWNASLPGSSQIKWDVRVRPRLQDGGLGAWSAWIPVGNAQLLPTPLDPAVCAIGGPTPCPKDLFAPLGGIPAARYENLELRISMLPDATGLLGPTLFDYKLLYTCVGAE